VIVSRSYGAMTVVFNIESVSDGTVVYADNTSSLIRLVFSRLLCFSRVGAHEVLKGCYTG